MTQTLPRRVKAQPGDTRSRALAVALLGPVLAGAALVAWTVPALAVEGPNVEVESAACSGGTLVAGTGRQVTSTTQTITCPVTLERAGMVRLFGTTNTSAPTFAVGVDGGAAVTVTRPTSPATVTGAVLYTTPSLPAGAHTVEIKYTANNVTIDFYRLDVEPAPTVAPTTPPPTPTPTPTPEPTPTATATPTPTAILPPVAPPPASGGKVASHWTCTHDGMTQLCQVTAWETLPALSVVASAALPVVEQSPVAPSGGELGATSCASSAGPVSSSSPAPVPSSAAPSPAAPSPSPTAGAGSSSVCLVPVSAELAPGTAMGLWLFLGSLLLLGVVGLVRREGRGFRG